LSALPQIPKLNAHSCKSSLPQKKIYPSLKEEYALGFCLFYLGTVLSFCQTLVFCFCSATWSYEVCFIEMMVIGNSKERIGISWGRPQQDSGLPVWIHQTSSTFHSEKVPGDDHHASPTVVHTSLLFQSLANSTAQLALEPVVDTTADHPPPSSP